MRYSIQSILTWAILSIVIVINIVFGVLLYRVNVEAIESRITSNVETISKPLKTVAERGVSGGNIMKLKGDDAQAIYVSSEAMAIYISGTSDGYPKTQYTAEIPPKAITYTFYDSEEKISKSELDKLKELEPGFERKSSVYIYKHALDIKNKGELVAIFPAFEMASVTSEVLQKIAPPVLIILAISGFIAYFISQKIVRPIGNIADAIFKMDKEQDLTAHFESSRIEEINKISETLNHFVKHLCGSLRDIASGQGEISEASGTVSVMASKSEADLEQQKHKLDLLVSSITQMSAAISQVAQNAMTNANDARESEQLVEEGVSQASQTTGLASEMEKGLRQINGTLTQLDNETDKIGSVLSVIVGIAEQTNLLALNAAIEAARAGEQGRGFAVVADEVRSLAVKTQDSTGEVSEIIQRLQQYSRKAVEEMEEEMQRVDSTVKNIDGATTALNNIQARVANIAEMTRQICESADEQSAVCEDVSRNIHLLSELADTALLNASETNHSVAHVEKQISMISKQIQKFKVG